ncbi:molybdopterin cofactor-binding domain-containing protein [Nonomuraea thailandensis]
MLTALAQIAADALGADLGQVRMLAASTTAGPDEGITAGSRSISHAGPPLREACARVRAACAAEAARRWGVSPPRSRYGAASSAAGIARRPTPSSRPWPTR